MWQTPWTFEKSPQYIIHVFVILMILEFNTLCLMTYRWPFPSIPDWTDLGITWLSVGWLRVSTHCSLNFYLGGISKHFYTYHSPPWISATARSRTITPRANTPIENATIKSNGIEYWNIYSTDFQLKYSIVW